MATRTFYDFLNRQAIASPLSFTGVYVRDIRLQPVSGLFETPSPLEQPRLPSRDRLPVPLVTADSVGQPLLSAVPIYGTTPL